MSATCDIARGEIGSGIAASLRAVDCIASEMTQTAFGRLFGTGGALVPALTILLTLYVAFFAFSLLTGRSRLGVSALTPRMITLGLVLTFATSWMAYSTVVWNLATGAPDQIAGIMTGVQGSATQVFADKIDIVFLAIGEAAGDTQKASNAGSFSPPNLLWLGALLFLLGTVGLLVTTRIALAVLVAAGPVFVVLALFPGTRGLFAGWLRGLVLLAITPLFAVLGGTMMLELAVPVIAAVLTPAGEIDPRAAMAFFLIGAVHLTLMVLVTKTASAMVNGWTVFGLVDGRDSRMGSSSAAGRPSRAAAPGGQATANPSAATPARAARATPVATSVRAANDAGPTAQVRRETVVTREQSAAGAGIAAASSNRARGIGSRFRDAPIRSPEKSR